MFTLYTILLGIEYLNLPVFTCMFMVNQLCNYAPIMALITYCDCHSHIAALWHSMRVIYVCNKWNVSFSLIDVFHL